MKFILIGTKNHKRSTFFEKAAKELKYQVEIVSLENIKEFSFKSGDFIKIDPPIYQCYDINLLPGLVDEYILKLKYLSCLNDVNYLNYPKDIIATLDKVVCKKILIDNNILTTPMILEDLNDVYELRRMVRESKNYNLFIKPKYGSGAAGVIAYKYNPRLNKEIIYTSIVMNEDKQLINTKKIRRIDNALEIENIINNIAKQDLIVEKWIPKSKYEGISYDLRVVYQYGKIDFIIARGSKCPITNLHLNNCAIDFNKLSINKNIYEKIKKLCNDVAKCFPKLNSLGIDMLITPKGEPMVIEVNGQGDLIYSDIFNENNIYKSQMIGMIKWKN